MRLFTADLSKHSLHRKCCSIMHPQWTDADIHSVLAFLFAHSVTRHSIQ